MKKKILILVIAALCVITCVFGLTACFDSGNGADSEVGNNTQKPDDNQGNGNEENPDDNQGNGNEENPDENQSNAAEPTEGLVYTLSDDETYYICDGLGTATETDIVIASEYNGKPVTYISSDAFMSCKSLTSVMIPESVTSIAYRAFSGCKSLASIIVDEKNQNYASQDGILYNKLKTTFIHIPQAISGNVTIPDGVTSINEQAFSYCSGLTSIIIPNSVTSLGEYAFYNCRNLMSIILDGVVSIGSRAFYGCSNLASVTIGGVTFIGNYPFSGCNSLTSIYYKGDIASWCKISGRYNDLDLSIVYIGEQKLQNMISVTIPDGVTHISAYAFNGCSSLTSVTIGNGVTVIGDSAFKDCSSLTNIKIPNSVTSIDSNALSGCSSLASITFDGTKVQWNAIFKRNFWNYNTGEYTVHCTDGDIAK